MGRSRTSKKPLENVMSSLFGLTRRCEGMADDVKKVENPGDNQRFLLSTKLPRSAGPSCGSADPQGGPVNTMGKRDVFERGTCGNRGRPTLSKKKSWQRADDGPERAKSWGDSTFSAFQQNAAMGCHGVLRKRSECTLQSGTRRR